MKSNLLLMASLTRCLAYESFIPEDRLGALKADLRSLVSRDGPDFLNGQRDRVHSIVWHASPEQRDAMQRYVKSKCSRHVDADTIAEVFEDLVPEDEKRQL